MSADLLGLAAAGFAILAGIGSLYALAALFLLRRFARQPMPQATPRNADLIVHSQLQPANGDPVAFNYLMRNVGGDWKAEDVYLDGTISQLAVRRSEFTAILSSEGPDGLLTKLKAQSDGLLKSA